MSFVDTPTLFSEPELVEFASQSWLLTQRVSPRDLVRVPVLESAGVWANSYPVSLEISGKAPSSPWAMNLAGDDRQYRFVCFDFDAKSGNSVRDAARLGAVLDSLNIRRVETISGPSGGRHVWLALAEAVDAGIVSGVADLAKQLYSSLDTSMLKNPSTGAVRPPWSPHRVNGYVSLPLDDDKFVLDTFHSPTTTPADLELLMDVFIEDGAERPKTSPGATPHGVETDPTGHLRLAGSRRDPSPAIKRLLEVGDEADKSTMMHRVLSGLANARWSFTDVTATYGSSPAFEHARTRSHGATRLPRTVEATQSVWERAWQAAVMFVASHPLNTGSDEGFQARVEAVAEAVAHVQSVADSFPGRWQRSSLSHRLVLDAICLVMLQAARDDVEVDIRRLALTTGYGREMCRKALHALRSDEWIVQTAEAEGIHGAMFALHPKFSTVSDSHFVVKSEYAPRPLAAIRERDIESLATRLETMRSDLFTARGGLGRRAGLALASIPEAQVVNVKDLTHLSGLSARTVRRSLRRLAKYQLVARIGAGWITQQSDFTTRQATKQLGVDGFQAARALSYETDRMAWAWWLAELNWLRKRGKKGKGRRPSSTATPLFDTFSVIPAYPQYPRRNKKPDHRMARMIASNRGVGLSAVA